MNLFRVMLGLGLCGGLVLPCFSRHATAVDIVTARIECPSFMVATLGWTPKIGSDPTFGAPTGTYDVGVPFVSMSRQGQTIYCTYQASGNFHRKRDIRGHYKYTVQRAIHACAQKAPNVMECQVKK